MVKECQDMTIIMVLPNFNLKELAKFGRLNKACKEIMLKRVNYKVLFQA